jgi:hypothetical protein
MSLNPFLGLPFRPTTAVGVGRRAPKTTPKTAKVS